MTEVFKDYIVLAWDVPESDGGAPISGYAIEKSLSGGMCVPAGQVAASETQYKVTKLFEGNDYIFQVM